MKQVWLFLAGLFLSICSFAQEPDTLIIQVVTLEDVSIVDLKNDNSDVFKSKDLSVNSNSNSLSSDLGDLIQNTIPIYFKNYSVGGVKTIDFRGTGASRTKVYWNGMPINSPTLGGFDFSLLPFYFVEDARLRFGGASLADGGGGLGGSVQLVNPVSFQNSSVEINGSFGSFGAYTLATKALLKKGKFKIDTRIIYSSAQNNYAFINEFKKGHPTENRLHNEVSQLGLQQIIGYRLNNKHAISARFAITNSDRNLPPPISSSSTEGANQKDELLVSQLAWDWVPQSEMYFKVRSGYQFQKNKYFQENIVDATTQVQIWNNNIDIGYYGIKNLKLNSDIRFDKYWVVSDGVGEIVENQFTALLNTEWQITSSLKSVVGIRYKTVDNSYSPVMPYGGFTWKIFKKYGQVQINASNIYRFPTINDRYWNPGGNPDLNPEDGWNYEVGYNFDSKFNKVDFKLSVTSFYSNINNWLVWQPSTENPGVWGAANIWRVNNRGLEFISDVKYNFSDQKAINLRFSYSYTKTSIGDEKDANAQYIGKQLILAPNHQILSTIGISINRFNSSLCYRFVGERFIDRQNKYTLESYHLLDLVLGYYIEKPSVNLKFRLNNFLNEQYETVPGRPLPGINFNIELTFKIY